MKKILLILCAAVLALVSCNKDLTPNEAKRGEPVDVVFNLSATHPDGGGTKAVKDAWETGDVVFVFFSGQTAPAYLELKYDGTKWVNTPKGLSFSEGDTGTMTAVYLPFGSDAAVVADGTSYKFDKTYYSYYLISSMTYTVSDGEVSGTFSMQIPDGYVQFFLDDETADPTREMELRERHLTRSAIERIHSNGMVKYTEEIAGGPLPGYVYDKKNKKTGESKGWVFSGFLDYGANTPTEYHFTLVSGGWEGDYYSKEYTGSQKLTLYQGPSSWRALRFPALSDWEQITDYKPIDLGIDLIIGSSRYRRIYWSSRNLGASSDIPSGDTDVARQATWGDYYAWGELAPYYQAGHAYDNPCSNWESGKTGYDLDSYIFYDGSNFTKYTNPDDVLFPANDAATQVGGRWRMATKAEWEQLLGDCTWEWNDVYKGRVVKSKIAGFTDRYIFLPAAGGRRETSLSDGSKMGRYWSASKVFSSEHSAFIITFDSGDFLTGGGESRFFGRSIRPVCD